MHFYLNPKKQKQQQQQQKNMGHFKNQQIIALIPSSLRLIHAKQVDCCVTLNVNCKEAVSPELHHRVCLFFVFFLKVMAGRS